MLMEKLQAPPFYYNLLPKLHIKIVKKKTKTKKTTHSKPSS